MDQDKLYCAMIADIKNSKKMSISERRDVQEKLIDEIALFNKEYEQELAVPMDFSRGDQIQALFHVTLDAYKITCLFREKMFPVQFRIGLGVGDWSVRVKDGGTNAQDGTSYHRAAQAFAKAHKENRGIVFFSGEEVDAIINVLIRNEDNIFANQTDMQKKIARLYYPQSKVEKDSFGVDSATYIGYTQKHIAKEMNTGKQNISQYVRRGRIIEQQELKSAVLILLQQHFEGQ